MTGRWVSPIGLDRMCPIVSGGLLEMTGRWGPTFGHDQTNVSGHSWNLTRSDQTLGSCVRSWHCAASGHHLTIGIGRSVFEDRDDVAAIRLTGRWYGASGRSDRSVWSPRVVPSEGVQWLYFMGASI